MHLVRTLLIFTTLVKWPKIGTLYWRPSSASFEKRPIVPGARITLEEQQRLSAAFQHIVLPESMQSTSPSEERSATRHWKPRCRQRPSGQVAPARAGRDDVPPAANQNQANAQEEGFSKQIQRYPGQAGSLSYTGSSTSKAAQRSSTQGRRQDPKATSPSRSNKDIGCNDASWRQTPAAEGTADGRIRGRRQERGSQGSRAIPIQDMLNTPAQKQRGKNSTSGQISPTQRLCLHRLLDPRPPWPSFPCFFCLQKGKGGQTKTRKKAPKRKENYSLFFGLFPCILIPHDLKSLHFAYWKEHFHSHKGKDLQYKDFNQNAMASLSLLKELQELHSAKKNKLRDHERDSEIKQEK